VAEFSDRPAACTRTYRVIALRKLIRVEKHQQLLFYERRFFFYVSNVRKDQLSVEQVVFDANARCNQEAGASHDPSPRLLTGSRYAIMLSRVRISSSVLGQSGLAAELPATARRHRARVVSDSRVRRLAALQQLERHLLGDSCLHHDAEFVLGAPTSVSGATLAS
jgi:hypothetical protein